MLIKNNQKEISKMSNINFCHFTSIREIWNWKNNITIPDIQRGLVWNAAQIEVFWDSILRGIPIGFFTISQINDENILLDGQQRWNAIISAKDTKKGTLWCCIPSKNSNLNIYNRKYLFRWTTDDHPWGWHFDADEKSSSRLSLYERRQVLEANKLSEEQLFKKIGAGKITPYPCHKVKIIKFVDLLEKENAPEYFENEEKTYYQNLRNDLLKAIEQPIIPIIGCHSEMPQSLTTSLNVEKHDEEWLDTFFRRMNSQGTPFTQSELAYSALKGSLKKIGINNPREFFECLSNNFTNTANIAQIVLQLATHKIYKENINKTWNANEIKIFFRDKDDDIKILKECLAKIEKLFEKLENYRKEFNNSDKQVDILPYHLTILPNEVLKTALIILQKDVDIKLFWGIIWGIYFFCKDDRINGDKNCLKRITQSIIDKVESNCDNCNNVLKEAFAHCIYEGLLIPPATKELLEDIDITALENGKFNNDKEKNILIESRLGKTFYWWHKKSFTFITLACGKYLNNNFSNTKNLLHDNRPWDYDHCYPVSKSKSKQETNKMCWSSGNNVPIALTINRSKQDQLPNDKYPDNTEISQELLYIDKSKINKIEKNFNEFAKDRFIKMFNKISNSFEWDNLLNTLSEKNLHFKNIADEIIQQTNGIGSWYYVMDDMEFRVKSENDFLRYKWFTLRNSDDSSYAITTCDFQTFECVKRKATLSVVMRGVPWNEEYSTRETPKDAISYINEKWSICKKK